MAKLEFKVVRDGNGNKVTLENMTLAATDAVIKLLKNITSIVTTRTAKDAIFKITEGSATVTAEAPDVVMEKIEKDFNDIIAGKATDKNLVDHWREIQTLFKANGLQYEASFYRGSNRRDLATEIKSNKRFRTKSERSMGTFSLEFLSGKMMEVGGQKPNVHMQVDGKEVIISCDETEAKKVIIFLYQQLHLSAWCTSKGGVSTYELCDFYLTSETFDYLRGIFTTYINSPSVDRLEFLHEVVYDLMQSQDFGNVAKLLRLFESPIHDVSTLRTLLVITKGFKDHDSIADVRANIKTILEGKIGSLV